MAAHVAQEIVDKLSEIATEESRGELCPEYSAITQVEFWEPTQEISKMSLQIALNYLQALKDTSLYATFPEKMFECICASFLRVTRMLCDGFPDSAINAMTAQLRKYEPLLAYAVKNFYFPIGYMWLEKMPEICLSEVVVDNQPREILNTKEVPPKFQTILPSSYTGKTLWVGGEKSDLYAVVDSLVVNADKKKFADILADGSNPFHLMLFPDAKFEIVRYNHLHHISISVDSYVRGNVLKEIHRMLKVGGVFEFQSSHFSYENKATALVQTHETIETIRKRLIERGFEVNVCGLAEENVDDAAFTARPFFISVEAVKL